MAIRRRPVSSRMLRSVGYDGATGVLELEFTDGGVYRYFHVPVEVHYKLMHAESKGAFFQEHICDRYQYEHVMTALPSEC